jgi:hypothetical protein
MNQITGVFGNWNGFVSTARQMDVGFRLWDHEHTCFEEPRSKFDS